MTMQMVSDFNTGSNAQRGKLLTSQVAAGVLVAKDANTLQFFGLPTPLPSPDSYLGTASYGFDVRPVRTAVELDGCFYVLYKESEVDASFPFRLGSSFVPSDAAGKAFTGLEPRIRYQIGRIPIALPVILGTEELLTGTVDENHLDMLANLSQDPAPTVWYAAVREFNQGHHAAITAPENASSLAAHLPPDGASSPVTATSSPFVPIAALLSDTEMEERRTSLDKLTARLAMLSRTAQQQQASQPPTAMVAGPPAVINIGGGAGGANGQGDADGFSVRSQPQLSQEEAELRKTALRERVKLQLILARLEQDPTTGAYSMLPGTLTPAMLRALSNPAKTKNEIFLNLLLSTHKKLFHSFHKIVSKVDIGCTDKLFIGFLSSSTFLDLTNGTFQSLESLGLAKNGATVSMFLPDSTNLATLRRQSRATTNALRNQRLLGDNPRTMDKEDQTLMVMSLIQDVDAICGLGANLIAFFYTGTEYDVEKETTTATPLVHTWFGSSCSFSFLMSISSGLRRRPTKIKSS